MLKIEVREAADNEKLNVDVEAEELPEGVRVFDSTDWNANLFMNFKIGDWVVTVVDDSEILQWTSPGVYLLQMGDDGGFFKKLKS